MLAGLQEAAGKARVEVVAVNYLDDRDVYRDLLRKFKGVQLTMTHDGSGAIGKSFGVDSIPRLFVIDQAGKVAYVHAGYGDDSLDRILDAVNTLLVHPASGQTAS
ncbi:MAG: Thioredoxin [Xanthomonadaceae bacterium]|nr:Thioredoxin [Xanthomonadaceae bacterium]